MQFESNRAQLASCLCGALLLLAASTPLWSAVYQCKGPDGSTVFSDSPCGADAKLIIVRPQPPMSNTPQPPKRAAAGTANRSKTGSGDADALKCQAREYGAWYQSQNPKPSREQSDAKMGQIVESCWLATQIVSAQDNVAVAPNIRVVTHKAPQPIAGGAAMPGAPAAPGTPLQVSRSRQPEEAARWKNYYSCRTQSYQDWSGALGHAPNDEETREAQERSDAQCRAQFSIPSGAAAIITD